MAAQVYYSDLPDDLHTRAGSPERSIHLLRLEADELWSFVGNKSNKQWLWLTFDPVSREVLAFYVGDRSRESARELWQRIPAAYRQRATTSPYKTHMLINPFVNQRGQSGKIENSGATFDAAYLIGISETRKAASPGFRRQRGDDAKGEFRVFGTRKGREGIK